MKSVVVFIAEAHGIGSLRQECDVYRAGLGKEAVAVKRSGTQPEGYSLLSLPLLLTAPEVVKFLVL